MSYNSLMISLFLPLRPLLRVSRWGTTLVQAGRAKKKGAVAISLMWDNTVRGKTNDLDLWVSPTLSQCMPKTTPLPQSQFQQECNPGINDCSIIPCAN
eukprot:29113-Amphidinium_carterae.1